MSDVKCKQCGHPIEDKQVYVRAFIRDSYRQMMDMGEQYYHVHLDCLAINTNTEQLGMEQ